MGSFECFGTDRIPLVLCQLSADFRHKQITKKKLFSFCEKKESTGNSAFDEHIKTVELIENDLLNKMKEKNIRCTCQFV